MGGLRRRSRGVRKRGAPGYILLDAIVAMVIALIGLTAVMGSLSALGRIALREGARLHSIIEQRNTDAQSHPVAFQGK